MSAQRSFDPFAPRHEPAATLYAAFLAEAAKRKGRMPEVWIPAEIDAVHAAAVKAAAERDLPAPTRDDVERAERYARGSADYGAKWAAVLANDMLSKRISQ